MHVDVSSFGLRSLSAPFGVAMTCLHQIGVREPCKNSEIERLSGNILSRRNVKCRQGRQPAAWFKARQGVKEEILDRCGKEGGCHTRQMEQIMKTRKHAKSI